VTHELPFTKAIGFKKGSHPFHPVHICEPQQVTMETFIGHLGGSQQQLVKNRFLHYFCPFL
jgi:hypothetical protein